MSLTYDTPTILRCAEKAVFVHHYQVQSIGNFHFNKVVSLLSEQAGIILSKHFF